MYFWIELLLLLLMMTVMNDDAFVVVTGCVCGAKLPCFKAAAANAVIPAVL